ncbi:MAG: ABC transporter substrate-binding protein [Deltaproteobacteria bacterium]|nr:MAG: ABC transporter substrate-binding protein [Deltaproteobacteria bacterium]
MTRRRDVLRSLAALLLAAACGRSAEPAGTSERTATAPRGGGGTKFASQTLLSDEILWDLGPQVRDRVVAVSSLADDPRYSLRPNLWPAEVPRIATGSEALVALEPDVVIVATFTAPEVRERLTHLGLELLVLPPMTGTAAYRRSVEAIAARAEAPEAGRELVARFETAFASHGRVRGIDPPSIVAYAAGVVAGSGTTFDEAARHTGWVNAAAAAAIAGHAKVDPERLLDWSPDAVVIPCGEDCGAAVAAFVALPGFDRLDAVRHDRVVAVPDPVLHATGFGLVDLAARLAAACDGIVPPGEVEAR